MHVAVPVAGQQDMLRRQLNPLYHLLADIFVHLLFYHLLGDGAQRIDHKDAQTVLMAVQCVHSHLGGLLHSLQTGHIAVLVHRHLQLAHLLALDVIAPHRCRRVAVAGKGILIGGMRLVAQRQRVFLHLALVVAHPYQLLAIGGKHHRVAVTELLFVHPVGNAVDDLVLLAVLRHLHLGIVIQQLHQEDVVVTHKGNLLTVGREQRRLLLAVLRQGHRPVVSDIIYIIGGGERVAIDGLALCLQQDAPAVRTHDEALQPVYLVALRRLGIKQRLRHLARLERALHNALVAVAHLHKRLAVSHWLHSIHRLRTEHAARQVLQFQFLSICRHYRQQGHCYHNNLSHIQMQKYGKNANPQNYFTLFLVVSENSSTFAGAFREKPVWKVLFPIDLPRQMRRFNFQLTFLAYSEGWQSDRSRWTRNPVYPFRVSGV